MKERHAIYPWKVGLETPCSELLDLLRGGLRTIWVSDISCLSTESIVYKTQEYQIKSKGRWTPSGSKAIILSLYISIPCFCCRYNKLATSVLIRVVNRDRLVP